MARSPRGQVRSARRPRIVLAILNGRGHKLARLVVSRGRADSWIESEQLFPLDAIFQFEHLNNREGEDIPSSPPPRKPRESPRNRSSENGKKTKKAEEGMEFGRERKNGENKRRFIPRSDL